MAMEGMDHVEFTADNKYKMLRKDGTAVAEVAYEFSADGRIISVTEEEEKRSVEVVALTENELTLVDDGIRIFFKRKG